MRRDFVFDDGGMNLLSSNALELIRGEVARCHPERSRGTPSAQGSGEPLDFARGDTDVTLFVFSSGRPGLFAAGADMAEMRGFDAFDAERFARLGQQLFDDIERLPCITVALIDGDCFGGALDLALAFDLRFATPRSRFAHPGAKLGIVTGFGGTTRWRRVVSRAAANQLFLANRTLDAQEALQFGLVDRVAESHEDELARLETIDGNQTAFVKLLSRSSDRLSRRETLLLARRLGALYRS